MAQITFEMVGKLRLGKESDKFKPYQERSFESGWTNRTLLFNAVCGDNRHMLTIQGGTFPDRKDYKIVSFTEGIRDGGKYIPGDRFDIPWKERLLQKNIDKTANMRLFIVDLNKRYYWDNLKRLNEKIENGDGVTDADLKQVGLEEESQVAEALEKATKKRHEFISQWDQAEFMKKVLESEKYQDTRFYIRGVIEKQYSEAKDMWYERLIPQRIYLADDDMEDHSTGTATLYYDKNAIDDRSVAENGKYYINAYTFEYDSNTKSTLPCPFQLVITEAPADADEKAKKLVKRQLARFTVEDDSVKEFKVEFDMLNGAQRVQIDESMLSEDELLDLECGLITMEELVREYGGSVYGDRVVENRFLKPGRGYTKGVKETVYTSDAFVIQKKDTELPWEEEDLFDEDDL